MGLFVFAASLAMYGDASPIDDAQKVVNLLVSMFGPVPRTEGWLAGTHAAERPGQQRVDAGMRGAGAASMPQHSIREFERVMVRVLLDVAPATARLLNEARVEAVLHLYCADSDAAIGILEHELKRRPGDVVLLNDLSVAYLAKAEEAPSVAAQSL